MDFFRTACSYPFTTEGETADVSNTKMFVGDTDLNVDLMMGFVFNWVENIVEKGKILSFSFFFFFKRHLSQGR